jgi:hypothetical protein
MMPSTNRLSREEMIARHESPDYDAFKGQSIEAVRGPQSPGPSPVSIRLSRPLLEALDRMADSEHRKRSNLIQHILWEYVHAHDCPKRADAGR